MVAANVGTLLGNLCGALMRQVLTDEQLLSWGWRIPFFSGVLIAFVACYLHKYGAEGAYHANSNDVSEEAIAAVTKTVEPHNPIKVALRRGNRLALFSTSIVPMLWAAGFYVSFVWIAIFMEELMDPPVPGAFWINSLGLLFGMTWVLPVAGAISDRIGRTLVMTVSGLLLTGLGPICLILIARGNVAVAFASQLILGLLLSFYGGPLCAWLVESFSPEVRMTSASIGYDMRYARLNAFAFGFCLGFVGFVRIVSNRSHNQRCFGNLDPRFCREQSCHCGRLFARHCYRLVHECRIDRRWIGIRCIRIHFGIRNLCQLLLRQGR
jgi:MHS family proline/betaine transporter-like MFS transporter